MSHFAIGDLQGCAASLKAMLKALPDDSTLIFCGDLINRGPSSLETLEILMGLGARARCLLGNHDLHFLATAAGLRRQSRLDTLDELLVSGKLPEYVDWLRQKALAIELVLPLFALEGSTGQRASNSPSERFLMVHAGVLPQWTCEHALSLAGEVSETLRGAQWRDLIRHMYGNEPDLWSDNLKGVERQRLVINAMTRARFMYSSGALELKTAEGLDSAPAGTLPWFDHPGRQTQDCTLVFGHWSSLGLMQRGNLISLDTGCVWGGPLTAVELETRRVVQVPGLTPRRAVQDPGLTPR